MMKRHAERIRGKLEEQKRVETFEARNRIQYDNLNAMSVVRFFSGPVKFIHGWLDRMD